MFLQYETRNLQFLSPEKRIKTHMANKINLTGPLVWNHSLYLRTCYTYKSM